MTQLRIPAVYMRGGTSKGAFFLDKDLPPAGEARDRLLLRVMGSPDPYGKQTDGLGGATSSTSKVVVVCRSSRRGSDVDYWFGAVSVDSPVIDWSGNCGNLTAAVGPFAISSGLVDAAADGLAPVRIWQGNLSKRIIAHVPMMAGEVVEEGGFILDGVAFPGAEIRLEFIEPGGEDGADQLFPTGRPLDSLQIPGVGTIPATLINAGNPTIFVAAADLGLKGTELQAEVNSDSGILRLAEKVRAHGAVAMGLVGSPEEATSRRPATPKLAYVAAPAAYTTSDGRYINADSIDLLARTFSMGMLHHAMTGTGAVALAAAAAIPGTVVRNSVIRRAEGPIRFGHPSGTLNVGADAAIEHDRWVIKRVELSRSARRLMEGWVRVPRP